jgi:hypothetical protein
MKKLLVLLSIVALGLHTQAQSVCLSTLCLPVQVHAGDSALIGAIMQSDTLVKGISYSLVSGPNVPTFATDKGTYFTQTKAQYNSVVKNLVVGTYSILVTGTDASGVTKTGQEFIIVSPAVAACPPIPTPRTAVSAQVTINGVLITIPLKGTPIQYSDGTTQ